MSVLSLCFIMHWWVRRKLLVWETGQSLQLYGSWSRFVSLHKSNITPLALSVAFYHTVCDEILCTVFMLISSSVKNYHFQGHTKALNEPLLLLPIFSHKPINQYLPSQLNPLNPFWSVSEKGGVSHKAILKTSKKVLPSKEQVQPSIHKILIH